MPMPHRTFAQVAKRRLVGKEGRDRIRAVNELLSELPDYRNGPYADLRKWLLAEIEDTRVRSNAVHRDSIDSIHHDLAATFTGARIWGPSARFDSQKVGRDQPVQDGDIVEILRPM